MDFQNKIILLNICPNVATKQDYLSDYVTKHLIHRLYFYLAPTEHI